jgi:hypothetical protein
MKTETLCIDSATETEDSQLDAIEPGASHSLLELGDCVNDEHPTMAGRIRIRMRTRELWLPCLATVRARVGDRVLVAQVGDGSLLVAGVVDGFRERRPQPPHAQSTRRIRDDEAVVIESPSGEPLVEIRALEGKTTLRVLTKAVRIEGQQHLELSGESVSIVATKGPIALQANEDVVVTGETIHLN